MQNTRYDLFLEEVKKIATKTDGAEFLTVKQACEYLGIGMATLYRIMQRGGIKTVKLNGARRIRPSDLALFVVSVSAGDLVREGNGYKLRMGEDNWIPLRHPY